MKSVYPVIFTETKDSKNTVLIEVPDLEILTEGYGIENAIEMARDAIGLQGITKEDMEEELVAPTPISEIDISRSVFAGEGSSFLSMVDIDFTEYRRQVDNKAVRRNVTLPSWLNKEAEKAHINVSRVLQDALMAKLGVAK